VKHTLILGLGNPLLGDEGIGVRVVEELQGLKLPEGVDVAEGGTAGLGLIGLMEGYQRVIVVDAAGHGPSPRFCSQVHPSGGSFKNSGNPAVSSSDRLGRSGDSSRYSGISPR